MKFEKIEIEIVEIFEYRCRYCFEQKDTDFNNPNQSQKSGQMKKKLLFIQKLCLKTNWKVLVSFCKISCKMYLWPQKAFSPNHVSERLRKPKTSCHCSLCTLRRCRSIDLAPFLFVVVLDYAIFTSTSNNPNGLLAHPRRY